MMTDTIADYATRIRNALMAKHDDLRIPSSNMKVRLSKILLKEGYIKSYSVHPDNKQGIIEIALKYDSDGKSVIAGIKRVSKPGRRIYSRVDEIPKVLNGLGIAIISTSKGVMTDRVAQQNRLGGEILLNVW